MKNRSFFLVVLNNINNLIVNCTTGRVHFVKVRIYKIEITFGILFFMLSTALVQAADSVQYLNIPRQRVDDALTALGRQADVTVIYAHDLVKGHYSKALQGNYSLPDAVNRLLAGTDLKVDISSGGHLIISKKDSQRKEVMRNNKNLLAAAIAFFMGSGTQQAVGQSNTISDDEGRGVLEEVIITATKRSESLQDVPISITALTSADIESTGSVDLRDLAGNIPNFTFPKGAAFSDAADISIRGVFSRTSFSQIGFDSGLGIYVDGVYVGKSLAANADLLDVARVEVLRGPQGTLFGKNTIAGAINIVSETAGNELEGSVELETGDYDLKRLTAKINIPIIDDVLAARLSYRKDRRDGYVTNLFLNDDDVGSYDNSGAHFQLNYTPNDSGRIKLNVSWMESESKPYMLENLPGESSLYPADTKNFTIYNSLASVTTQDGWGMSLVAEYDFANDFSLTSVTGYRDDQLSQTIDVEMTTLRGYHFIDNSPGHEMFTQELRIASPTGTWYDYVAGVYYFKEENTLDLTSEFGVDWFTSENFLATSSRQVDVESYAVFFHANFYLSDQWTLLAGARYTDETKELPRAIQGGDILTAINRPVGPINIAGDVQASEPSWKLGLRYEMNDELMLYGSVSTGFKSGAYNTPHFLLFSEVNDPSTLTVGPEFVTNYEVGFKSRWADGRVRLNGAVFYLDYEDLQVRSFDPLANGGLGAIELKNAATATSQGFELELSTQLTDSLSIVSGLGYVNAEFDSFKDFPAPRGGTVDASGNKIPLAPELTLNVAIQYEGVFQNNASWFTRLDYSYTDERYAAEGAVGTDEYRLPEYHLLNARIGFRTPEDDWGITLWVKNLTDEDKPLERRYSGNVNPRFGERIMDPRTYGASISYNF